jgi:hypothetical protein
MNSFNGGPIVPPDEEELYAQALNKQAAADPVLGRSQMDLQEDALQMPGIQGAAGTFTNETSLADHYRRQANPTRTAIEDVSLMPDLESMVSSLLSPETRIDPSKQVVVSEERGDKPLLQGGADDAGLGMDKYNLRQMSGGGPNDDLEDPLVSEVAGMLKERSDKGAPPPELQPQLQQEQKSPSTPGLQQMAQDIDMEAEAKQPGLQGQEGMDYLAAQQQQAMKDKTAGMGPFIEGDQLGVRDRTKLYINNRKQWFSPQNQARLPAHVRGKEPSGIEGLYFRDQMTPLDPADRKTLVGRRAFNDNAQLRLSEALDILDSYETETELLMELSSPIPTRRRALLETALGHVFLDTAGKDGKERGSNFTESEQTFVGQITPNLSNWSEMLKTGTLRDRIIQAQVEISRQVKNEEFRRGLVHSTFEPSKEHRNDYKIRYYSKGPKSRPKYYITIKGKEGKPMEIPYTSFLNKLTPEQQKSVILKKKRMKGKFREGWTTPFKDAYNYFND